MDPLEKLKPPAMTMLVLSLSRPMLSVSEYSGAPLAWADETTFLQRVYDPYKFIIVHQMNHIG